jgi:hypothetical protein
MLAPDTALDNPLPKADLPEVLNHTGSPSQYFQTVDPHSDVYHVIALKVSYDITRVSSNGQLYKSDVQTPLATQDTFDADPEQSDLFFENDLAPYKPKCDFYLSEAISYAPEGKPQPDWLAGISLGEFQKVIRVIGSSHLERHFLGYKASAIEPTRSVAMTYRHAFGGVCLSDDTSLLTDEDRIDQYCDRNPLGMGFAPDAWVKKTKPSRVAIPQLLDPSRAFDCQDDYPVMGFGPIPKTWLPRRLLGGTYDEAWVKEVWPRLPKDHDYRFWNCAPEDQQRPFPQGGEPIQLLNLYPSCPKIRFYLPAHQFRCLIRLNNGVMMFKPFQLDTVRIDMKTLQLYGTYRVAVPASIDVRVLETHQVLAFKDRL